MILLKKPRVFFIKKTALYYQYRAAVLKSGLWKF